MDFPAAIIAAYSVTLDVGWLVRRDDIIVMAMLSQRSSDIVLLICVMANAT